MSGGKLSPDSSKSRTDVAESQRGGRADRKHSGNRREGTGTHGRRYRAVRHTHSWRGLGKGEGYTRTPGPPSVTSKLQDTRH